MQTHFAAGPGTIDVTPLERCMGMAPNAVNKVMALFVGYIEPRCSYVACLPQLQLQLLRVWRS